jgi:hypothetical protein
LQRSPSSAHGEDFPPHLKVFGSNGGWQRFAFRPLAPQPQFVGAVRPAQRAAAGESRPGGTTQLSISLPAEEARLLEQRAKRVYGGNVSRVLREAIRYVAYEEGRDALIASFGRKGRPTPAEAKQLEADWGVSDSL